MAKQTKQKPQTGVISHQIAPKSVYRTRQDIAKWNQALNLARSVESPKHYPLQLLYNEIVIDALLSSQIENRRLKSLSASFTLTDSNGNANDKLTDLLQNKKWVNDINEAIINSRFFGHSLIDLKFKNDELEVTLIERTNVDPVNGFVIPDYQDDIKKIPYREMPEYGTWILEFGKKGDLGLLNSCVPHVLFKRFAQSCWSELCEIYGIPPRVMKTNTHDKGMVSRSEKMMRDMGAAAWFIIDSTEEFQFAQGVQTNGDVYKNLIQLCNNENSMVISGAIIGQDTVNGNRSKDESAQVMLQSLIESDLSMIEMYWNSTIIPALVKLGIVPEGTKYHYDKAENLEELWTRTKEALPYFDVNPEWIKDKFGIEVEGKKQTAFSGLSIKPDDGFFV